VLVQEVLQSVLALLTKHRILLYDGTVTETLPDEATLILNHEYQRFVYETRRFFTSYTVHSIPVRL